MASSRRSEHSSKASGWSGARLAPHTAPLLRRAGQAGPRPGAAGRLDIRIGSPQYCRLMIRLPPPLRRVFAAFAAVMVLFAPVTQVAHAQAMTHAAADCEHPTTHQHVPASSEHSQNHQHAGTCCDICSTGCAAIALLSAEPTAVPSGIAHDIVISSLTARSLRNARAPHLLPFSQAPPLRTA